MIANRIGVNLRHLWFASDSTLGWPQGMLLNQSLLEMKERQYAVILEDAGANWSGYSPDVPGVAGVGDTPEDCEENVREGIELYLLCCRVEGIPVPNPSTRVGYVKVAA
ncbi:MAG TPA: type II toxin-antitoxin system HicB family antitoxin [Fimbriimonas sp.]|nr:type II toxin-antitoxin system HicB family antitoxin [Fimbriimonas sp.]